MFVCGCLEGFFAGATLGRTNNRKTKNQGGAVWRPIIPQVLKTLNPSPSQASHEVTALTPTLVFAPFVLACHAHFGAKG